MTDPYSQHQRQVGAQSGGAPEGPPNPAAPGAPAPGSPVAIQERTERPDPQWAGAASGVSESPAGPGDQPQAQSSYPQQAPPPQSQQAQPPQNQPASGHPAPGQYPYGGRGQGSLPAQQFPGQFPPGAPQEGPPGQHPMGQPGGPQPTGQFATGTWSGDPGTTGWSGGPGEHHQALPQGSPPLWQPPAAPGGTHQRSPLTVLALVLACVLVCVAAVQTVLLVRTNSKLDEQKRSVATAQSHSDKRFKSLEGTVKALEERAKKSLDAAAVAKKVLPSVFQVVAGDYTGSSFVIGSAPGGESYLLTNDHVVQPLLDDGSSDVELQRGDSKFPAKVVQHDKSLDIAVLECDQKFEILTTVKADVQPGEPVVVVGSPLGLNDSVTTGVVSSAQRDVPGSDKKFIQFDAAINPGNSGGPVMNAKGEVVGIATEKARDAEGIGLAIPISVPCDKFSVCRG